MSLCHFTVFIKNVVFKKLLLGFTINIKIINVLEILYKMDFLKSGIPIFNRCVKVTTDKMYGFDKNLYLRSSLVCTMYQMYQKCIVWRGFDEYEFLECK